MFCPPQKRSLSEKMLSLLWETKNVSVKREELMILTVNDLSKDLGRMSMAHTRSPSSRENSDRCGLWRLVKGGQPMQTGGAAGRVAYLCFACHSC